MPEPAGRLRDKTALITGAASGIGRSTAELFAREGAHVIVADLDVDGGHETLAEVHRLGADGLFIRADVSSEPDVIRMLDEVVGTYGALDVLHNNAAIYRVFPTLEHCTLEDWERTMRVNATGAFLASKHGLAAMAGLGRGGRIINTVSVLPRKDGGWNPGWGVCPDYMASKGAIVGLTTHIASIGAPHGVLANCLAPNSAVNTPMQRATPPQMSRDVSAVMIEPEDVAAGALYLATASISGAILAVSPGRDGVSEYEVAYEYTTQTLDMKPLVSSGSTKEM